MTGSPDGKDQAARATHELYDEDDDDATGVVRQTFQEAMAKLQHESRRKLRELKETFEDCATVERRVAQMKKAGGAQR